MRLIRKPWIGCRTRHRAYSARSILSSCSTGGVTHPPHTLSRGKICLSRITVVSPESRNFQAQELPAGPAPTIKRSHESISLLCLRFASADRDERESREFAAKPSAQRRFEKVARCRGGIPQSPRRDRAARFSRNPDRTFLLLGRRNSQIHSTNITRSAHNAAADFRRRGRTDHGA